MTNDERLDRIEQKVDNLSTDVASIKADLRWLKYVFIPILTTLAGAVVEHVLLTGHP